MSLLLMAFVPNGNSRVGRLRQGRHGRPPAEIRRCGACHHVNAGQGPPRGSIEQRKVHPDVAAPLLPGAVI